MPRRRDGKQWSDLHTKSTARNFRSARFPEDMDGWVPLGKPPVQRTHRDADIWRCLGVGSHGQEN